MSVTTPGAQLKCKVCGESEFTKQGNREVCRYCGTTYAVSDPGMESELRTAESFRESAQFEVAANFYQKIIRNYKDHDLSDAYWGLFLCEQRVLFETDAKGERFPSFFSIVPNEAQSSPSFLKAVEAAEGGDAQKAEVFRKLCKKIAAAKELYRQIGQSSKPFDIFICFKKSLMSGEGFTKDWKMAYDLYDRLSGQYNVFFSEKTLNNVVVHQYEPNIYYGLYTAKVMLLLCSKREYLESQWVKNEWSRFYAFGQNPAAGKTIIPIFIDDFAPEQLPAVLQSYQGYPADYNLLESLSKNLQTILKPVDKEEEARKVDEKLAAQQQAFEKELADLRRAMKEQNQNQAQTPPPTNTWTPPAQPSYTPPTTPTKREPTVFYDDAVIKEEIKQEKKYKQMLTWGIVCLFLCFWVGIGLLVARAYMINKATAAKVNEFIAAGAVYRANAKADGSTVGYVKERKFRKGWLVAAVIFGIVALILFSATEETKALAVPMLFMVAMSLVYAFSPKGNPYILKGAIGMKKGKFFVLCVTLAILVMTLMILFGERSDPLYYDSGYPMY
jgi:hypothetical protein